jgi:hypothetical protein
VCALIGGTDAAHLFSADANLLGMTQSKNDASADINGDDMFVALSEKGTATVVRHVLREADESHSSVVLKKGRKF